MEGLAHELNWKYQDTSVLILVLIYVLEWLFWKLPWSLQQWSVLSAHTVDGRKQPSLHQATVSKSSIKNILRCKEDFFPFNGLAILSELILIHSL